MRTLATFVALALLPTTLLALETSFSDARPEALASRELKIATGAKPGEPVVFDYPDAATAVARPVKDDEDPTPAHPFYRFEWLSKDKSSARFYAVRPQAEIDQLRKLNAASTATNEGRALESSIIMAYINKGAVIRTCMNNDKELPEAITMYVTLAPGQAQARAVVVPEGSIADCVMAATERGAYPAVKAPITARDRIALTR